MDLISRTKMREDGRLVLYLNLCSRTTDLRLQSRVVKAADLRIFPNLETSAIVRCVGSSPTPLIFLTFCNSDYAMRKNRGGGVQKGNGGRAEYGRCEASRSPACLRLHPQEHWEVRTNCTNYFSSFALGLLQVFTEPDRLC